MSLTLRAVVAASTAVVVLGAVAGCGSSHGLTARQVERAFSRAGIPFASEQDRTPTNPYLRASRPQSILLPRRAQPYAKHVTAFLIATNPVTFRSEIAYVFDSSSNAEAAVRTEPLAHWMTSNNPVTTARVANVLILATTPASRVHEAISSLTEQSG
ncbi:MAG TPA: hypothetical protein VGF72_07625 [Gaiellaceae bacterium]|jgi:hypothetical protein